MPNAHWSSYITLQRELQPTLTDFHLVKQTKKFLLIPEKFIMMRSEEMDSAHIVHKGGAKPPSYFMHQSVSWTKYTARPARKTLKSWQTVGERFILPQLGVKLNFKLR